MLGKAAERIIRRDWGSEANLLAQELYALLRPDAPIISSGPVQLTPTADVPAIQITMPPGSTSPPITVNGAPITTSGGGGGTNLTTITWPGQVPGTGPDATPAAADNPITLYGEVIGKLGGDTYSVRCWAKNPDTSPPIAILTVQQRAIDPADTIPPLTPVFVLAFPGTLLGVRTIVKAVMQVPVFFPPGP